MDKNVKCAVEASVPGANEVLLFQASRLTTSLFKSQLQLIEDLKEQHDIAIDKLINALPLEYRDFVRLADYFDEEQSQILRRKILGNGNDIKRQFEVLLDSYEIKYKDKK